MQSLTKTEQEILDIIKKFALKEKGIMPTIQEIAALKKCSSMYIRTSFATLKLKGYITQREGRGMARTYTVKDMK